MKPDRKQDILEALAKQLELTNGGRITTAALARSLNISEAALYRHFPSKARMFEGLIEFAESTLFSRINLILEKEKHTATRCRQIIQLFAVFSDRNKGIVTLFVGSALASEDIRLKQRVIQVFDRIETQLKQVLREASIRNDVNLTVPPETAATFLLSLLQGIMFRFQQSGFSIAILDETEQSNDIINRAIFS